MNIHHLELFYYVARHGGVTGAARHIPYGIQQPAISGQISKLEEYLGLTLFQRRPFALTPEGKKLYEFIKPFFDNLQKIADELQGGHSRHIRVGASNIVMREHLPELFQGVRRKFPDLKMSLREGVPARLEELLRADEIDLAVTLIGKKPPQGIHSMALMELPLILLVAKESPIKSAQELWRRDRIDEPLICMPREEAVTRHFLERLEKLAVHWAPGIEASSAELVEIYVANGFGVGVSVAIPGRSLSPGVRALPLKDFPPAIIGMLWCGPKNPLVAAFLEEGVKHVKRLGS